MRGRGLARQTLEGIDDGDAQRLEVPKIAGQEGQAVMLGRRRNHDVGETGGLAL